MEEILYRNQLILYYYPFIRLCFLRLTRDHAHPFNRIRGISSTPIQPARDGISIFAFSRRSIRITIQFFGQYLNNNGNANKHDCSLHWFYSLTGHRSNHTKPFLFISFILTCEGDFRWTFFALQIAETIANRIWVFS